MNDRDFQEIKASITIERKHFSEIFTSTVGVPSSVWYYRVVNEDAVIKKIRTTGATKSEADEIFNSMVRSLLK